jgi:hypothetical protein
MPEQAYSAAKKNVAPAKMAFFIKPLIFCWAMYGYWYGLLMV